MSDYYGDPDIQGVGAYRARFDAQNIQTSIVTRSEWLDLACPLTPGYDRLVLARSSADWPVGVDEFAARYAVRRLIGVAILGVRLTNSPIYRLLELDVRRGAMRGDVGLARFVD